MSTTLVQESRVTSKGQIVVPARLRRKLGITTGTRIRFIERGGEVLLQPVTTAFIRSLEGVLRTRAAVGKALLQERKRDERQERKRLGGIGPR